MERKLKENPILSLFLLLLVFIYENLFSQGWLHPRLIEHKLPSEMVNTVRDIQRNAETLYQ